MTAHPRSSKSGIGSFMTTNLCAASAFRTPLLAPDLVFLRHAYSARPVARRARLTLVEKENALADIAAAGDGAQRRRTVEPSVDARTPMAAEGAPPLPHDRRLCSRSSRAAAAKACMLASR